MPRSLLLGRVGSLGTVEVTGLKIISDVGSCYALSSICSWTFLIYSPVSYHFLKSTHPLPYGRPPLIFRILRRTWESLGLQLVLLSSFVPLSPLYGLWQSKGGPHLSLPCVLAVRTSLPIARRRSPSLQNDSVTLFSLKPYASNSCCPLRRLPILAVTPDVNFLNPSATH